MCLLYEWNHLLNRHSEIGKRCELSEQAKQNANT